MPFHHSLVTKLPRDYYTWFLRFVTTAMLVHTNKRILMNFFCYVYQHAVMVLVI